MVIQTILQSWLRSMLTSIVASLEFDLPTVFDHKSDYTSDNVTVADDLWEALDTNPAAVILTDDFSSKNGLDGTVRFPWDDERSIYSIKGFHQVHCLKVIRRAYVDYERGNEKIVDDEHVHHCLDDFRRDIICNADDTPINTHGDQMMQCRDWSKLIAWAKAPERNACYIQMSDYGGPKHELERYMNCPKDSPYYPVVEAYREKFGPHLSR